MLSPLRAGRSHMASFAPSPLVGEGFRRWRRRERSDRDAYAGRERGTPPGIGRPGARSRLRRRARDLERPCPRGRGPHRQPFSQCPAGYPSPPFSRLACGSPRESPPPQGGGGELPYVIALAPHGRGTGKGRRRGRAQRIRPRAPHDITRQPAMIALDIILSGLILGGMYAMVALGLTLQYGVARIMNLAYGEFLVAARLRRLVALLGQCGQPARRADPDRAGRLPPELADLPPPAHAAGQARQVARRARRRFDPLHLRPALRHAGRAARDLRRPALQLLLSRWCRWTSLGATVAGEPADRRSSSRWSSASGSISS